MLDRGYYLFEYMRKKSFEIKQLEPVDVGSSCLSTLKHNVLSPTVASDADITNDSMLTYLITLR